MSGRRLTVLLAAFIWSTGPIAAGGAAEPAAARGRLAAVILDAGPSIDGALNDAAWSRCPPLVLGKCTADELWPLATTARVLFDATRLYVAFECEEPDTDSLRIAAAGRDANVWEDDCVELFVTGDHRTGWYHFAVNPAGVLMDARSDGSRRDDRAWNSSAVVRASVAKGKRWTVTMAIPLAELGAYVGENQTWIMNLNRTRPARGGRPMMEWSWAVMSTNDYHQSLDYGRIEGVRIVGRADGVTRTAEPPARPPVPEEGSAAGGITVYRRIAALDIPDEGKGTVKTIDMLIRGSEGLKVAFLARGTGGAGSVPFNMSDRISGDNTTSKAYRIVGEDWRPVLYRVDRFRYNGGPVDGRISPNTLFTSLAFHGNQTGGRGVLMLRDLVIYRGEDARPPQAPANLRAEAGDGGVRLQWEPAADNAGVALYAVSRSAADGPFSKIAHCHMTHYVDAAAPAGVVRYRVLAVDYQDNVGPWSEAVSVSVPRAGAAPAPSVPESDRARYAERVRAIHRSGAGRVVRNRVLCFGDSLTGATVYRQAVEAALGRYAVEAIGRPGWRTDGCRKVIDADLEKVRPEYCFILLGTNNSKGPRDLPQAMDDLLAMARSCEQHGAVPIIGTIPPRGFKDPASAPEAAYNEALIKTCRENAIPVAYIFEAFQAGGDRRKLLADDGVHLVAGGWAVTGPAWAATFAQVQFVVLDR